MSCLTEKYLINNRQVKHRYGKIVSGVQRTKVLTENGLQRLSSNPWCWLFIMREFCEPCVKPLIPETGCGGRVIFTPQKLADTKASSLPPFLPLSLLLLCHKVVYQNATGSESTRPLCDIKLVSLRGSVFLREVDLRPF